MRFRDVVLSLAAVLGIVAAPGHVRATVLTFDPLMSDGGQVLQAYGDHVSAAAQNGFQYGVQFGITPNVITEYMPVLRYRGTGYGDLTNVLFREDSGDRILEVDFAAEPGFLVCLDGFDLATTAWGSLSVPLLVIADGNNNTLFSQTNTVVPGIMPVPSHTHIQFDPPLFASIIAIRMNLSTLLSQCTSLGIDNIAISQENLLPSPGGLVLFVTAGALVVMPGRRRAR